MSQFLMNPQWLCSWLYGDLPPPQATRVGIAVVSAQSLAKMPCDGDFALCHLVPSCALTVRCRVVYEAVNSRPCQIGSPEIGTCAVTRDGWLMVQTGGSKLAISAAPVVLWVLCDFSQADSSGLGGTAYFLVTRG